MQITREMLESKRAELIAMQEELIAQINVCNGAIENVDFWLEVLSVDSNAGAVTVSSPVIDAEGAACGKSNGKDRDLDLAQLGIIDSTDKTQVRAAKDLHRKVPPVTWVKKPSPDPDTEQ